jgi:hypothetical protein
MMRLKNVLLVNALTSGATGLLLILFNAQVAQLFGSVAQWPFIAAGIAAGVFLVLFAILVLAQSRRKQVSKGWVKLIIALDIMWVVESAIILLPQLFGLTGIGYALIGAVALWVALMAFLQIRGLKQPTF